MIYTVHTESLMNMKDLKFLHPRLGINNIDGSFPEYAYRPTPRLHYGMFELSEPEQTGYPSIVVIRDDDGPFAVCGSFEGINAQQGVYIFDIPSKYLGYQKNIPPLVVRPMIYRFPKKECSHSWSEMFWGLRRPGPFDMQGSFPQYVIDYFKKMTGGPAESLQKDIHRLYGELFEHADPECLRIARKWRQPCQHLVMTACVQNSQMVRQLFDSFPLLAWLLYVRTDVYPAPTFRGEQTLGSYLRDAVEHCTPLDSLAKSANIPRFLRRLDPHVLKETELLYAHSDFYNGYHHPFIDLEGRILQRNYDNINKPFERLQKMIDVSPPPKDTRKKKIWCAAYDNRLRDVKKIKWLYREMKRVDHRYLSKLNLQLGDWMKKCRGANRWRPELSWRQACRLSGLWHREVLEKKRIQDEELDKIPFPDAWFDPWERDDWRIEYIPTRPALSEHGAIQRNCVSTYAKRVAAGEQQIYRALLDGKDKLTISVRIMTGGVPVLGQVAAKANQTPDPEIRQMVDDWFKEMTADCMVTGVDETYEEVQA